ncbi:peroxisomal membrane protein 11C-like isoform X1 [Acipenser oxyrinchus oxyrinchus]|uniref:Peroxisomal membrane protein 11C-like isoform X1 n=1 Tax=Acipenser oxyrinchus oxyrinchus TaxID=40147 RepID=A0AAD8FX77_ACIOX|nr:peroxisomal membrane protein 11C-like isoform X1 [Acipenser oxyrinchus oxyrinchus]
MASSVNGFVNILESYRGRDKVVRTLCYGSQLAGGVLCQKASGRSELGKSLLVFSAQLSQCRTVLRLFDDLSMYAYSRDYGLGAKDEDSALRCMSVLNNLADQLYYPCEHLAWAADAKVISTQSGKWWTLSTALWGISLLLGIMRSLRTIVLFKRKLKQRERDRCVGSSEAPNEMENQQQLCSEVFSILSSMADFANAVNWMPPGFLWAGKFPDWLVGLLGTTSSLISLYQMCAGRRGGSV